MQAAPFFFFFFPFQGSLRIKEHKHVNKHPIQIATFTVSSVSSVDEDH